MRIRLLRISAMLLLSIFALFVLTAPETNAHASFIKPQKKDDCRGEYEAKMLEYVKTYAPDQMSRWEEQFARRDRLRRQLLEMKKSGAFSKLYEKKREELQKKIESGEMTREEADQNIRDKQREFIQKHMQWKEEGKKLREQLDKAVEQKDEKTIAETLNTMLDRLTKANDRLEERIESMNSRGNAQEQ